MGSISSLKNQLKKSRIITMLLNKGKTDSKGTYLIIHVFVDKKKDVILVPIKECKVGYALAVEPYKKIDNTEWDKLSIHIVELLNELKKQSIVTDDTESNVMRQICGKQSFKQFSKKNICISITYLIQDKTFKIQNLPRLSNGAYGTMDTLSNMYSTEYTCAEDITLIQENFIKAYEEAEKYLDKINRRQVTDGKIEYCFGYKTTWFAIKSANINSILSSYPNLTNAKKITWKDGLDEVENSFSKVFISGVYEGWTFLVGLGLCDPSHPDDIIDLLMKFGQIAEEVCYFSSHRTVSSYGFARVIQGKIDRLYCYVGDEGHIYKTIGERTEAEKALSLNLPIKDEELFEEGFDEISEEDVLSLAQQWSINPQLLIGEREQESIILDIA